MLLKKVLQPVNALYPWSPPGGAVTLRSKRKVILQNKCSTSINVFNIVSRSYSCVALNQINTTLSTAV